jgi:transposase
LEFDLRGHHLCADKGYDSHEVIESIEEKKMIPHVKSRGEEIEEKKKNKSPKRWAIERTMSWINQFRRLKIRWDKKSRNYEAFCHLAFAMMAFKESGVLG